MSIRLGVGRRLDTRCGRACVAVLGVILWLGSGPWQALAQDALTATIQNGTASGYTTQPITITAQQPIAGPFVSLSTVPLGLGEVHAWNWHPSVQLASFYAAVQAGTARIVAEGDSMTRGFGCGNVGWEECGYPAELTQMLVASGIPAQQDGFLGAGGFYAGGSDNRVALVGGAQVDGNAVDAGGPAFQTINPGDGLNFTLNWRGDYDTIEVSYVDLGNGTVTVAVDGAAPVGTLVFGNSGNTLTQTIAVPAGMHGSVQVLQSGSASTIIQGIAFSSSTQHAIQVANAGLGGWTTSGANTSFCSTGYQIGQACGFGLTAGVLALRPSLVLLEFGANDIIQDTSTTLAGHQALMAAAGANLARIVANIQQAGSDVVIMLPTPFSSPNYAIDIHLLREQMRQIALSAGIGLFDLSHTYDDDFPALSAAGLMGSDTVHPDATLYADYAAGIAARLTGRSAASASVK